MKIRVKLIIYILLPVIVLFLAGIILMNSITTDALKEYAYSTAEQHAKTASKEIENKMALAVENAYLLSQLINNLKLNDYTNRSILPGVLESNLRANESFFSYWVFFEPDGWDGRDYEFANTEEYDETGNYAAWAYRTDSGAIEVTTEAWGVESYEEDYYSIPKKSKNLYISEPYSEEISDELSINMISVALPLINKDGEVYGVTGIDISIAFLDDLLARTDAATGGFSTIANSSGLIILDSIPERKDTYLSESSTNDAVSAASEALGNDDVVKITSFSEVAQTNFIQIFSSVKFSGGKDDWLYIVSIPEKVILQIPSTISRIIIGIAVLILIILSIVISLFSSNLSKSINILISKFSMIAEGNLQAEAVISSKDETGKLAREFNILSKTLSDNLREVFNLIENLQNTAVKLTNAMELTSAAFKSSDQSITESIMSESDIDNSLNSTVDSIKEITESLKNLEQNANLQTSSIMESFAAIEQLIANINSTAKLVSESRKYYSTLTETSGIGEQLLNDVNEQISSVQNQSESLLNTNTIIADIASQTNILSMNAAIEAAHAGEAGKGFAVVADEIRKLSEDTTQNSKNIDIILKKIVATIEQIVGSSTAAGKNFSEILNLIDSVSRIEQEINSTLQEQSSGSRQILISLEEMKDSTVELRNESSGISKFAEKIYSESGNLKENTNKVSSSIRVIFDNNEEVKKAVNIVNELTDDNNMKIKKVENKLSFFKLRE